MSTYIGGRIIPKHAGTWDETAEYETLTIVYEEESGDSYISRKAVPSGTALDDEEYWAKCSDYSVQLKNISDAVDVLEAQVAANVAASTDEDADYAAEVADARVSADGNTYDSLGEHIRGFEEDLTEEVEGQAEDIEAVSLADAANCRSYDFETTSVFAPGSSTYEIVEDEYGDSSYHIIYGSNNPMYQKNISSLLNDGDQEIIVELTARAVTEGSKLRVYLYNSSNGAGKTDSTSTYALTTSYHRYQYRLHCLSPLNTTLGIGPKITSGYEVQFKDVKILIPNKGAKLVKQPLKYFCGYPDDLDFSEGTAVTLESPIYCGIADYASEDNLYLNTIEFYASAKTTVKFYIGYVDENNVLQTSSSFSRTVDKGANLMDFYAEEIEVPAGYGVFAKWSSSLAVYSDMPDYGIDSLVSTEDEYYEDDDGNSGYVLSASEYMVPFRYTLIEKPFSMEFEELQDEVSGLSENLTTLSDNVSSLSGDVSSLPDQIADLSEDLSTLSEDSSTLSEEVEDARTHDDSTVYDSLGEHIRALDTGDAVEELDLSKVTWKGMSMLTFYNLFLKKTTSYFTASYEATTDTLTITCIADYSGDFILYAPLWTAKEYARMCQAGNSLLMKFQTSDVVNDNSAFRFWLWTATTSSADTLTSGTPIISNPFTYVIPTGSGEYEKLATFPVSTYDYDEDLECYVYGGKPVYLELILSANSAKAGDSVTICGNGGLFKGVMANGKDTAFCGNLLAGELYSLEKQVAADEETMASLSEDMSDLSDKIDELEEPSEELEELAEDIEAVSLADAVNCRSYDFETTSLFAYGTSTCEIIEDEYGDSSYHIAYGSNNPMYQKNISSLLNDGDQEIIVEVTARAITEGSMLRVHLYNSSNGASRTDSTTTYALTTSYHRYQYRLHCLSPVNTTLGIGPKITSGYEVQFKDVKILVPNKGAKLVKQPLKYFCGYPDDLDFSEGTAVTLDSPLYCGIADYAPADGLYLNTIELYASAKATIKFYIGCIDQYNLLQTLSSFSRTVDKGTNLMDFYAAGIEVPAGYGVFVNWSSSLAVYSDMPDYGIDSLISTEDNYYENDSGYSGYPLESSEYMVPFRYTLIEKPFNMEFEELQESVSDAEESIEDLDGRVTTLEGGSTSSSGSTSTSTATLLDPYGVKYSLLVSENGTLNAVRSIPNKAVVFGNSLTLGFGTFGMAASDSSHDYYYYVQQFLLEKNEDLSMSRYSASAWEGYTDSDTRSDWVDSEIASYIDGTEDLIIIQLSDNVNTTEKRETFPEDMYTILSKFRVACPNARILWVAAWYNWSSNLEYIEAACTDLGIDLVDITDLSTDSDNKSVIGNTYTADDGTVYEITSSGVASHPGDTGMELIAERIIEVLESYM